MLVQLALLARGVAAPRCPRQVAEEPGEVAPRGGAERRGDALVEVVDAQAPRAAVLAQLGDDRVALGIGGAHVVGRDTPVFADVVACAAAPTGPSVMMAPAHAVYPRWSMMDGQAPGIRLTPVSYIVLGLVARASEATPYELKQLVAAGIGDLWSVQHAQLYSEPERLTRAGLLTELREDGGRRRKRYRITDDGREAFEAWLRTPATGFTELRDPGLLQLCLGAEPAPVARAQLDLHRRKLAEYEALHAAAAGEMLLGARLTLESGIGHEREWVRFWGALADR